MGAQKRVLYETKKQPKWGLVPDEPEDVDRLEDAQAWARVYGEFVHEMSVVAADRPSADLLARLSEAERRWAWWRHRAAQLSGRNRGSA